MARDEPPAPPPPPPTCQSCLGVLYVSSEYGDEAARPVCVGLNRPAKPDGEPYDRREALARSFAGDYKLICLGAAEYDTPQQPSQQHQKQQQKQQLGLPWCVGIEVLIAAQRAAQETRVAAPAAASSARAPPPPPPPPPPRYRPPADPGSRAPANATDGSVPVFTAILDAAGIGTGGGGGAGGAGDGPLARYARRFAATADRNLGRMRDAAGRVVDVVGTKVGGGSSGNSGSSSSRRPPPSPPSASSSPPPPSAPKGGSNSSKSNNSNS